ncbi:MAG: Hsp20/alpha crystallin family protein [Deltaproteobacteria bacterium]|nr:Hsp20/alpha crystallin family protein [Deltaproteobacteria bacterium]
MDIKKLAPWNWFKKEEGGGKIIPVQHSGTGEQDYPVYNPATRLHREIDRIFDNVFSGFGFERPLLPRMAEGILKPTLDLSATGKEYTITVEIPGVDEKDVKVDIADDTMTIRGEKKQEKEENAKNYYRIERSYGSFQRVLSLPEDADQNAVTAKFKKGVLTVTIPRKAVSESDVKRIEVKSA